jgi:hypothetical protein
MTTDQLAGFVSTFHSGNVSLPGSHGEANHPRWDVTQYVCGLSNGFVSQVIMYGKYRTQNNALARQLGYRVGKFPLLPVIGPVVSALPHGVFEAYEEVFQFRSVTAATDWLSDARWEPTPPQDMADVSLPAGFIARAGMSGPNDGKHEHGIGISGRVGTDVIVVSFNGGRLLSWSDVQHFWLTEYRRLAPSLTTT